MKTKQSRRQGPTEGEIAEAARQSQKAFDDFLSLSDAEKTRVAEELGKADLSKISRPLTPAERALWNRAKSRLGRPRRGKGSKPVNVTIERELLARADSFAKRKGLTRSQVIARGLELAIAG